MPPASDQIGPECAEFWHSVTDRMLGQMILVSMKKISSVSNQDHLCANLLALLEIGFNELDNNMTCLFFKAFKTTEISSQAW